MSDDERPEAPRRGRLWIVCLLALVVLTTAAIRSRLLDIPLDRDEGEYAYVGQLLLQGVPPYATAYNLKLPGIYAVYAAILAAFGSSLAAIHLGLLVANAATIVLVFLVARRAFNPVVGVAAAATFAVLSLSPRLHGIAAYAEHFVLVPALAGALVLLRAVETGRLLAFLASGVLFGLAVVVKQSGAAFAVFGALYTLLRTALPGPAGNARRRIAPTATLAAGAVLPYAALCLVLALAGVFGTFWFWTVVYAYQYAAALPLATGITLFFSTSAEILATSYLVAGLAAAGLAAVAWDAPARARRDFVLLLAFCSLGGTSAGFYFRNQYFILVLPSVALLAGLGADALARRLGGGTPALRRALAAALTVVPLAHLIYAERAILLEWPPQRVTRALFGLSPFPESIEIARYLKARTTETDRIAVIGSEPQIYFYAGRPAATGYVYTYALMEDHAYAARMQRQMIAEIEAANPRFVVLVNASASWNVRPQSNQTLFQWWDRYQHDFVRVGVVDIVSDRLTTYVWGPEAAAYTPKSLVWLAVFERKGSMRRLTSRTSTGSGKIPRSRTGTSAGHPARGPRVRIDRKVE